MATEAYVGGTAAVTPSRHHSHHHQQHDPRFYQVNPQMNVPYSSSGRSTPNSISPPRPVAAPGALQSTNSFQQQHPYHHADDYYYQPAYQTHSRQQATHTAGPYGVVGLASYGQGNLLPPPVMRVEDIDLDDTPTSDSTAIGDAGGGSPRSVAPLRGGGRPVSPVAEHEPLVVTAVPPPPPRRVRSTASSSTPSSCSRRGSSARSSPATPNSQRRSSGSISTATTSPHVGLQKTLSASSNTSSLPGPLQRTGSSSAGGPNGITAPILRDRVPSGSFFKQYDVTREIDHGAFSAVYLAVSKKTQQQYAVKVVDRRGLSNDDDTSIFREAAILLHLSDYSDDESSRESESTNSSFYYPPVNMGYATEDWCEEEEYEDGTPGHGTVRLVDFFAEPMHFFIVMDLVSGGNLLQRVLDIECYPESRAKVVIFNLLKSIQHMHRRHIVHRDLKPENVLLVSTDDDTQIRIVDFGLAAKLNAAGHTRLQEKCGTPSYVAPEIIKGVPYDYQVDMWSAGVISYFVLGGYPPFIDRESKRGLFRKILLGKYEFHEFDWAGVSDLAKKFVSSLLVTDPSKRLTATQALQHPWLADCDGSSVDLNGTNSCRSDLTGRRSVQQKIFRQWLKEEEQSRARANAVEAARYRRGLGGGGLTAGTGGTAVWGSAAARRRRREEMKLMQVASEAVLADAKGFDPAAASPKKPSLSLSSSSSSSKPGGFLRNMFNRKNSSGGAGGTRRAKPQKTKTLLDNVAATKEELKLLKHRSNQGSSAGGSSGSSRASSNPMKNSPGKKMSKGKKSKTTTTTTTKKKKKKGGVAAPPLEVRRAGSQEIEAISLEQDPPYIIPSTIRLLPATAPVRPRAYSDEAM